MDHPLYFHQPVDDSYINEYLTQFRFPPLVPNNYPAIRDSQTLPSPISTWSISDEDNPPSTAIVAPVQQLEIIRMVESDKKIVVGMVLQLFGAEESLEIEKVVRWERRVVVFYCH
jgi:hypothetical protein